MNQKQLYTLKFALIICIVCSAMISITAVGLRQRQELNVEMDRKKNILNAIGLSDEVSQIKSATGILDLYDQSIKAIVVDKNGQLKEGVDADTLTEDSVNELAVYLYVKNSNVSAVAIPIIGKGLWSTLYGYLAFDSDMNTVRGITFYKHGETPGLGGEIEKPWFQENFIGKKIFDAKGSLSPIQVIKGKVDDLIADPQERMHRVDGISGATITSRGVTSMLDKWLTQYEPFFRKSRKGNLNQLIS